MSDKKDVLIQIAGGLGKNVMFTSLMPELKEKYEDIFVLSAYPDVFEACPYVSKAFNMNEPGIYQDLILDENTDVFLRNPYDNINFVRKEEHLFDAWREDFGLPTSNNRNKPALETPMIEAGKTFPTNQSIYNALMRTFGTTDIGEFIIVQFSGGQSPVAQNENYNWKAEGLKRNYFKAQELVDLYRNAHPDVKIIHYALNNEPVLEGTYRLNTLYLDYGELAKAAKAIICIDSSLQHLATGKCKHINVIWGETKPEHFGYDCNNNILPKKYRNTQPYFIGLGPSPSYIKFASPEEVFESVEEFQKTGEQEVTPISEIIKGAVDQGNGGQPMMGQPMMVATENQAEAEEAEEAEEA